MARRSIDRFHGKLLFIGKDLWRRYKKETGDRISYEEFQAIIGASMAEVQKWVLKEPIGFQLHPKLGHIAVNRFKPREDFKTYLNTSLGPVINHNLHTGGHIFKIQWFHSHTNHASRQPYWFFKANRNFNRTLAAVLKGGQSPIFNSYMQSHFITKVTK